MKKINFKSSVITTSVLFLIFSLFLFSLFTFNKKVSAQSENKLIISTTGYSMLSQNTFVFGGAYSNNLEKKAFTTYFQYKKGDANFDTDGEETIKIDRSIKLSASIKEYGVFYTNPELQLYSTYYFKAVGYFNDDPNNKFYGDVLSFKTGDIPTGLIIPFAVWEKNSSTVVCTNGQFINSNGICEDLSTLVIPPPSTICNVPLVFDKDSGICKAEVTLTDPVKATVSVQDITSNSALVKASVSNAIGSELYLQVQFGEKKYWETTKTWQAISAKLNFDSTSDGSVTLVNLKPETTYIYNLIDANSNDRQILAANQTFTTLSAGSNDNNNDNNGGGSAAGSGLVPCTDNCGFSDIGKLINTVMAFILKDLVLPLAAIMFAYAGFELVTSGGETSKREKAKKIFTNVAIGLIIVAAAFVIVQTVLSIVGYTNVSTWNQL